MLTALINRLKQGLWLGLVLLMLGATLSMGFNPYRNLEIKTIIFNNPSQQIIVGKVYLPKLVKPPFPVVILCHGINNSKQHSHLLGVELARSGIAAIAFDFGGFGESYALPKKSNLIEQLNLTTQEDTEVILNYITTNFQQFNLNKIGMIGHSMGGNTALTFAQTHPEIESTITLSFGSEVNPDTPKNLLFGVGLYEQLNPISRLGVIFQSALDSSVQCDNNKRCGQFEQGNARKLLISPTADHFTSPFDPYLIQESIIWTEQSLQLPPQKFFNFKIHWFIVGQTLIFVGGLIIGVYCLYRHPLWIKSLGGLILIFWGFSKVGFLNSDISSTINIFVLNLIFLSHYASQHQDSWLRNLKQFCLYSILVLLVFWVITLFANFSEVVKSPYQLMYLPQFFIQWMFFIVYNLVLTIQLFLTPNYTFTLTVSGLFWILLIVELLYPAKILNLLGYLGVRIINWLRQPFRLGIGKLSRKEVITLTLLGIVLTVMIIIRLRDGLLSEAVEFGDIFLVLFGKMILFPIVLTVLTIRSRWFRYLEAKIT
ncbi:MAG: alpha/beta hydrolase [Microcystaceae cyanobacterium]